MTELKSLIQPFIVRYPANLSGPHIQSLVKLYQPIIGPHAVSLYMLLMEFPLQENKFSRPRVHSALFSYLKISLHYLDQARLALEAIGLMKTYKETGSQQAYPTLVYDLSLPLFFEDFIDNPLLSNTLISQIGEDDFYQLSKDLLMPKIELTRYEEVSVDFATVFSPTMTDYEYVIQNVKEANRSSVSQLPEIRGGSAFDYDALVKRLMGAQVNHTIFGPGFKSEMEALHLTYGLSVDSLFEFVLSSYDQVNGKIILPTLRRLARKSKSEKNRTSKLEHESLHGGMPVSDGNEHNTPLDVLTGQSEQVKALSLQEKDLLRLMMSVKPLDMLGQLKRDRKGFVSAPERRYIEELSTISSLPQSVQTFLVYYLIEVRGRTDFQQGESQKVANEWQQAGIQNPIQALLYIKKEQALRQQKRDQGSYTRRQKRSEVVPEWMQKSREQNRDKNLGKEEGQAIVSQEELLSQLRALSRKEET